MKLINVDEEIPEYFYVFLNFNNSLGHMHLNNFNLTKSISSGLINNMFNNTYLENYINGMQKYLPFVPSNEVPSSPTSFSLNVVNEYTLEYNLELYRYVNVNKYPSRLSAIYAFGDYETCKKVSELYGWNINTVRKFRLKELKGLEKLVRVSKHNMEIISYIRGLDCRSFPIKAQNIIYEHYWKGKGNLTLEKNGETYSTGEIYEYLIEGIIELVED